MTDWRNPEDYTYTESLHVHDWAWEFLRRNPEYRKAWTKHSRAQERNPNAAPSWSATYQFNIKEPVDPDIPAPEGTPDWTEWVGSIISYIDPDDYVDQYGDGLPELREVVVFDLGKPLEPQIELARMMLRDSQKTIFGKVVPVPRPRRTQFPVYVRLLDAKAAGETLGEMARVLFSGHVDSRRSAKRALKSAEDQAASGYQDLLLLHK